MNTLTLQNWKTSKFQNFKIPKILITPWIKRKTFQNRIFIISVKKCLLLQISLLNVPSLLWLGVLVCMYCYINFREIIGHINLYFFTMQDSMWIFKNKSALHKRLGPDKTIWYSIGKSKNPAKNILSRLITQDRWINRYYVLDHKSCN